MQKYVNSFSWDFREVFIEKSKSVRFNIVNWKVKTPSISEDNGASLLSRSWKSEFFKVLSGENFDLKTEISAFIKEHDLSTTCDKIQLSWQDSINLSNDVDFTIISDIVKKIESSFSKYFKWNTKIKASHIVLWFSKKSFVVGNTLWNFSSDSTFYNTLYVSLVWEKDWRVEEVVEKITWVDIVSEFSSENIDNIFQKALDQLDLQFRAEKSPNGEMYVIIWNEAWWTIIHQAVWHWLEWDLQWSSVYSWKIWQKVADESVTIIDDPTVANKRWFYSFDHEWNPSEKTVLIENWILKSYLHTAKTAQKFWVKPTWHARKESYTYRNLVRMWTTYLDVWNDKKEDLLSKVDSWIYVAKMWWGQVDTVTWDFVFDVKYWFKIENWEIKNEIRWATISWNWPDMLNKIYWICNDLEFFDWWTCWKWQAMPVADANPTFLTKLKVTWLN